MRACSSEDRLFATLDPTTRRLALPGGEPVLLTDTVGFVQPPAPRPGRGVQEHARGGPQADYLVHVVDASAADPDGQIDAVREVLDEIDAAKVPELLVFNKVDLAAGWPRTRATITRARSPISVVTGEGTADFLRVLADRLRSISQEVVELTGPHDRGDVLAAIDREGEVVSTHRRGRSTSGCGLGLSEASAGRLAEFVVEPAGSGRP